MLKTIRVCDHPECVEVDQVAIETFDFLLEGQKRTIDLCNAHFIQFKAFQEQVNTWFQYSRELEKPARPKRSEEARANRSNNSKSTNARNWARANGYVVADRGRLAPEIVAAYEESQRGGGHISLVRS